ncbi:hypothetical protein CANCADRAFT_12477, partial [Tortispora caseinolytica NRRL Y-17796]
MQYVGKAIGSVSKTWNSINPATLSGAIDVIVVDQPNGELASSPFHVRFGKFSTLRPSQKRVDFSVNGKKVDLSMKLGDEGEAFFVFQTDYQVPEELMTSPLVSPSSSPSSTVSAPSDEPDLLRLDSSRSRDSSPLRNSTSSDDAASNFTSADTLSEKFAKSELPVIITDSGDIILDAQGYKFDDGYADETEAQMRQILSDVLRSASESEINELISSNAPLHSSWTDENASETNESNSYLSANGAEAYPPTDSSTPATMEFDTASLPTTSTSTVDLNSEGTASATASATAASEEKYYVKTLRLTSDQLKSLDLKPGRNDCTFSVNKGKATCQARIFYWSGAEKVVISDIDGTITKSDALGHVLTMIGRDWTHVGVAKLYSDIAANGYKMMYLTSRSIGQSDSTRSYLNGIIQEDGYQLPEGPVILSPDRTITALRREVIYRKPEIFKMATLRDLKSLFSDDPNYTPFYAGFGNRIADALSYRSVSVPSSRIFTINSNGEVHMELLELAGYRSSYVFLNDLVDQFFPPVTAGLFGEEAYTDLNYWREPIPELSDLESETTSD